MSNTQNFSHYLSLGQAAKLAEVAKSTITRAIEKGQLSVTERVGNGYRIDPAELQRWQGTRTNTRGRTNPTTPVQQNPSDSAKQPKATPMDALSIEVRNARLEAELTALRQTHAQTLASHDELKTMTEKMLSDKDKEIERLYTLALTDQRERRRKGFWSGMFGGKGT